jgi:hypothetical protein
MFALRLLTIVSWVWLLAGCTSKTTDPTPPATTGLISGTVSPVDALMSVTATSAGGLTFVARPVATTGVFTLPDLAPGTYTLSFEPAAGYATPAARTASVTASQTTSAGTILVSTDGSIRSGSMSWSVNGVTYSTTNVTGGIRQLGGAGPSLVYEASASAGSDTALLSVVLGNFGGFSPGTYVLGSPYQSLSYRLLRGGVVVEEYNYGGATGTFTTTAYNATTGVATGTFGYVIAGPNSTRVSISNGTFTLRF